MARWAAKRDEDAERLLRGINNLDRVFNGVPMGLRPTNADENVQPWTFFRAAPARRLVLSRSSAVTFRRADHAPGE